MKIHEIVSLGAEGHASQPAIIHGENQVTYGELDALSSALAEQLRRHDLAGGHGFVFLPNSIEYTVGYFGISKAGGVVAPTPISLPHERLLSELSYCDADYVVTDLNHADVVREAAKMAGTVRAIITISQSGYETNFEYLDNRNGSSASHGHQRNNDEIAVLISTSGTASNPKRVMLTHRNLLSNIKSFQEVAQLTKNDRAAIVLPMTAVGTNTTEHLAYLYLGMTLNIYKGVFVLGNFCRLLDTQEVTVINVTPFILTTMLSRSEEVSHKLSSVKKIFFASAPFAVGPFRKLTQAFPTVAFYYGYGLTEASPRCTTLNPAHHKEKLGSSGSALRHVEIAIVDDDGRSLPCGEFGEVVVKGPNVMLGYYKKPEETNSVLRDGWLQTGDCGYLDKDGFLFIHGRKKNIIITRGISVSPEEVEQEILGYPDVTEAYVAGYSDERLGESIVAYVVPRNNSMLSQGNLKDYLRHHLDPAKIPRRIEFVSQLQRNHNQKLIRG